METDYLNSKLYKIRHSTAHFLAEAVLEFFPEAKVAIGPPIKDGFYYDFDVKRPFTEDDLKKFEKRMKQLIKKNCEFSCREETPENLKKLFADQPYKIELIDTILEKGTDDLYTQNTFTDLCRGPHVENSNQINPKAIKLLRTSGAYWRGDETRPMLQRIYGTVFETREELDGYLKKIKEAKERDHRTLGKKLDYFSFSESVGLGLPLWHPKGALIRQLSERFSQDAHSLNGYEAVITPHIGKAELWETSGHLDFYEEGMFKPIDIDGDQYYLKPMNCPFHIQIFKSKPRSYRELPKRFAEFGTVYRYERSGVLNGLTRVRGFTQDDAHLFCLPEQVREEVSHALNFSLYVLKSFGLHNFKAYISTRPEKKYVGELSDWENATNSLIETVQDLGLPYEIDEGGGAFYGPKIDLKLLDVLDREWQLSTVQFDFNLPKRFNLEYIGSDGNAHTPVMVHRALFGSAERFFAMLVEHYKGDLPLWLSPTQAVIIPISDKNHNYAYDVADKLKAMGMRVEVDDSSERMGAKIRNSELNKIPYGLIIGDKEAEDNTVSVRLRKEGDIGIMPPEEFFKSVEDKLSEGIPGIIKV
ncbi:UNVERIFIED_CONTAM: hypothetical protein GTU68_060525 [Idotea baltica]|nr:hypothetical protein [Idotea baltica]